MKRAALLVVGVTVGLAGCKDMIPSTAEPETIAAVEITPGLVRLDALGATTPFEAIVLTESGAEVVEAEVTWSTSNSSVATVNAAGVVTAVGNGNATIEAEVDGVISEASVIVQQTVHAVSIGADSIRLNYVGATSTLQAQAVDPRGNAVQGATVTWRSTAPDTVTVSATGQITAIRVGTALVIAEAANGQADTIRVRVRQVAASVQVQPAQDTIQVGQTTQLAAVVRDSASNIVSGAPITWSSSATGTATVSNAGLVTGVSAGTATITATSGSATGSAQIRVELTPLGSVRLTPDSAVVFVDSIQRFRVTLRDASGNIVSPAGRTITWTSSATSIATVTATGDSAVVTGVAEGTANIIVSSGGRADTARVRVISPCAAGTIAIGQTQTGSLTTTDCQSVGKYLDRWTITVATDTVLRFNLSSAGFDPVLILRNSGGTELEQDDNDGPGNDARIERRLAPGTYTLEVTSAATGGLGSYTLSASYVPVASVVISPDSVLVGVGDTGGFQATLFDAGGGVISPSGRTFTWTSTAPGIASVTASGDSAIVTGHAVGTANIIVSSGGRADTARVRVTTTCGGASIAVGQSLGGTLATTDCQNGGKYYDVWTLTLSAQTTVRIDMTSSAVDAYLLLQNQTGGGIAEDDDGAGGTNARIERTLAAGTYRIVTTSVDAFETGAYTLSVTAVAGTTPIGTARQQPLGTQVTVVGVITAGNGNFTDHSFYLQDATGGIAVWTGSNAGTLAEGDSVRVSGTIDSFNQEVEIGGTVTVTPLGNANVPSPVTVSSTQVNAGQRQGELLQIAGATVDSVATTAGTYRVYMRDASGAFVVQVDTLAFIPRSTFQAGSVYTITGIAGRTVGVFYLQPRRTADVQQTSTTNPCTAWNSQSIAKGQSQSGTLLATDCAPGDGFYYEGYQLSLSATTSVDILLTSTAFDAFLVLTASGVTNPGDESTWLASNDDGGGGTNSRLGPGSLNAGNYILWVSTAFTGQTGAYTLSVQ